MLTPSIVEDRAAVDEVTEVERRELDRREHLYRDDRPAPQVAGSTAILVDDGLATGSSMRAAIAALRPRRPAAIVVAVPVEPVAEVAEARGV